MRCDALRTSNPLTDTMQLQPFLLLLPLFLLALPLLYCKSVVILEAALVVAGCNASRMTMCRRQEQQVRSFWGPNLQESRQIWEIPAEIYSCRNKTGRCLKDCATRTRLCAISPLSKKKGMPLSLRVQVEVSRSRI